MARPDAVEVAKRLMIFQAQVVYALIVPPRNVLNSWFQKWPEGERAAFTQTAESKRDEYWRRVRDAGMWDAMSPREQAFAQTTMVTMTSQQQIDARWRMEATVVLMWALQLTDAMPEFDTLADTELLKRLPPKEVSRFVREAALRPVEAIDRAREVAEFWHWRSRTRKLQERGDPFPQSEKLQRQRLRSYDDIVRLSARLAHEKGTLPTIIDDDFPVRGKAYRDLNDGEWADVRSIAMERHYALNWLCGYAPENQWDQTPTST